LTEINRRSTHTLAYTFVKLHKHSYEDIHAHTCAHARKYKLSHKLPEKRTHKPWRRQRYTRAHAHEWAHASQHKHKRRHSCKNRANTITEIQMPKHSARRRETVGGGTSLPAESRWPLTKISKEIAHEGKRARGLMLQSQCWPCLSLPYKWRSGPEGRPA